MKAFEGEDESWGYTDTEKHMGLDQHNKEQMITFTLIKPSGLLQE